MFKKISFTTIICIMIGAIFLTSCGVKPEKEYTNNLHNLISNYDDVEKIIWDVEGSKEEIVDGRNMQDFEITNTKIESFYNLMVGKRSYGVCIRNDIAVCVSYNDPDHPGHIIQTQTKTYKKQKDN